MSKFKDFIRDVIFVSKLTRTKNKKIRISLSVLFLFLSFGCDLLIIIVIANLFQSSNYSDMFFIEYLINNLYLLPVIVVVRQVFGYLDILNTFSLKFDVEENLRVYLIQEVFDKGNFSIGDAYHFMNSFALSVGAFYYSLTAFIASLIQLTLYAGYLIYSDAQTIFILLGGVAVLYLPTKIFTKKGRMYAHRNWEASQEYSAHLQKILENIFLIKLLKKVNEEVASFRSNLNLLNKAQLDNQKVGTLTTSFPSFATYFLLSIMLAFFNFAKILTLDFIGILVRLFQEFSKLNKNIMLVSNNHVVIEKLYNLEKNKAKDYSGNFFVDTKSKEAIKFEDVSFEYFGADTEIFENINFKSSGDTELLLKLWELKGKSMFKLLDGMFAFAIWDNREKELILARDRFGEKPLFYSVKDNIIFLSSRLKSLMLLDKVINKRGKGSALGFGADVRDTDERNIGDIFKEVEPEDLLKFGLIPEFVGRLPVIATLEDLDVKSLVSILTKPKNALIKQYQRLFEMENIELSFTSEALSCISEKAIQRKTGARGLRSILEGILLNSMFDLPGMTGVSKVVVNEEAVNGNAEPLLIYQDLKEKPA